uniref:Glycosyltransferase 2-like domain-containing protein n=1 Tax=Maylandia zebra TaxID=106582 RepID=A0A3P9CRZ5_9CICH
HRTTSVLSKLLFALPNSPLQYPIQGYTVHPTQLILQPGGSLHLWCPPFGSGVTTTTCNNDLAAALQCSGFSNEKFGVQFAQFAQNSFYSVADDLSQVTIATKTFLRYEQLKVLLDSIRKFYSTIKVIVADDNFEPEHITGENIQHYIMPPAQGWFAGRNLAVSQVTTKYFLWVDDDFLFTEKTKIEKLVEVMEAVPELDVVGGSVKENQFYFSLIYEEGEETEGGCLYRKSNKKLHSVPGYPQCFLASGVVNFFLARTDAVQRVGFDPKLQRIAHSEFFMDGLGYLLVATCGDVSIDHQHVARSARYRKFRNPRKDDSEFKLQLHFFKNHLKCIKYG